MVEMYIDYRPPPSCSKIPIVLLLLSRQSCSVSYCSPVDSHARLATVVQRFSNKINSPPWRQFGKHIFFGKVSVKRNLVVHIEYDLLEVDKPLWPLREL